MRHLITHEEYTELWRHGRFLSKRSSVLIEDLQGVAYNLWWSWNPAAQHIFHELSPFFWEDSNHNAVEVIHWVSGQELRGAASQTLRTSRGPDGLQELPDVHEGAEDLGGQSMPPSLSKDPVAYFSAEFGLHESLRIYSGGLGHSGGRPREVRQRPRLPFVGITLFYRQGYFQQHISARRVAAGTLSEYDPAKLPIRLVIDTNGKPIVASVEIGNDT